MDRGLMWVVTRLTSWRQTPSTNCKSS